MANLGSKSSEMIVLSISLFFFLSLSLPDGAMLQCGDQLCGKTPPNFASRYLEVCTSLGMTNEICTRAWMSFLGAFAGVNASDVQPEDYDGYFDVLPIEARADQSLFWSRTNSLVRVLSMMNMMGVSVVSSANTPSSQIILCTDPQKGNFNWCSAAGLTGLDLENCCPCSTTTRFWIQFSTRFAQAASGTVFFLADGTAMPAFRMSSFFNMHELPNLNTAVVKRLVALDIHKKGSGEACGQDSLVELRIATTARGIDFDCYDIYGDAANAGQTQTIAECVRSVVDNVQKGTESNNRQIECNSAKFFQTSVMFLLVAILLSINV